MKNFFVYEVKTNGVTFYVGRASRICNVEHRIEKFKENAGKVPMKPRGIRSFINLSETIKKILDEGDEITFKKVFQSDDYLKCIQKEKELTQQMNIYGQTKKKYAGSDTSRPAKATKAKKS